MCIVDPLGKMASNESHQAAELRTVNMEPVDYDEQENSEQNGIKEEPKEYEQLCQLPPSTRPGERSEELAVTEGTEESEQLSEILSSIGYQTEVPQVFTAKGEPTCTSTEGEQICGVSTICAGPEEILNVAVKEAEQIQQLYEVQSCIGLQIEVSEEIAVTEEPIECQRMNGADQGAKPSDIAVTELTEYQCLDEIPSCIGLQIEVAENIAVKEEAVECDASSNITTSVAVAETTKNELPTYISIEQVAKEIPVKQQPIECDELQVPNEQNENVAVKEQSDCGQMCEGRLQTDTLEEEPEQIIVEEPLECGHFVEVSSNRECPVFSIFCEPEAVVPEDGETVINTQGKADPSFLHKPSHHESVTEHVSSDDTPSSSSGRSMGNDQEPLTKGLGILFLSWIHRNEVLLLVLRELVLNQQTYITITSLWDVCTAVGEKTGILPTGVRKLLMRVGRFIAQASGNQSTREEYHSFRGSEEIHKYVEDFSILYGHLNLLEDDTDKGDEAAETERVETLPDESSRLQLDNTTVYRVLRDLFQNKRRYKLISKLPVLCHCVANKLCIPPRSVHILLMQLRYEYNELMKTPHASGEKLTLRRSRQIYNLFEEINQLYLQGNLIEKDCERNGARDELTDQDKSLLTPWEMSGGHWRNKTVLYALQEIAKYDVKGAQTNRIPSHVYLNVAKKVGVSTKRLQALLTNLRSEYRRLKEEKPNSKRRKLKLRHSREIYKSLKAIDRIYQTNLEGTGHQPGKNVIEAADSECVPSTSKNACRVTPSRKLKCHAKKKETSSKVAEPAHNEMPDPSVTVKVLKTQSAFTIKIEKNVTKSKKMRKLPKAVE